MRIRLENRSYVKAREGLAWFPDRKRLAHVKFVEPKVAGADCYGRWVRPALRLRERNAIVCAWATLKHSLATTY